MGSLSIGILSELFYSKEYIKYFASIFFIPTFVNSWFWIFGFAFFPIN